MFRFVVELKTRVGIILDFKLEVLNWGLNTIFNILREWDPLKIILAIYQPKSHVRLMNTRLYFRRVVSIKMRVC